MTNLLLRAAQIKLLAAGLLASTIPSPAAADRVDQQVVEGTGLDYLTGDPDTWPPELEATVAAPDNHKVLLENDQVRVLEVSLAPGAVEPTHFHRWPSILYIQQAGDWQDRDAEGNVIFDSREHPPMQFPFTMWKEAEAPHSPVNLSKDTWIRLVRVEIKGGAAAPFQPSFFPADRSLTHPEDGVVLADGTVLTGDWDHGLVAISRDGGKRPFGSFAGAGFRTKPDPMWNSPNGVSWEPDMRHVLVADITGGHIYRVDTRPRRPRWSTIMRSA